MSTCRAAAFETFRNYGQPQASADPPAPIEQRTCRNSGFAIPARITIYRCFSRWGMSRHWSRGGSSLKIWNGKTNCYGPTGKGINHRDAERRPLVVCKPRAEHEARIRGRAERAGRVDLAERHRRPAFDGHGEMVAVLHAHAPGHRDRRPHALSHPRRLQLGVAHAPADGAEHLLGGVSRELIAEPDPVLGR